MVFFNRGHDIIIADIILVLAGTAGTGRMALPTSTTISTRPKHVQEHSSSPGEHCPQARKKAKRLQSRDLRRQKTALKNKGTPGTPRTSSVKAKDLSIFQTAVRTLRKSLGRCTKYENWYTFMVQISTGMFDTYPARY